MGPSDGYLLLKAGMAIGQRIFSIQKKKKQKKEERNKRCLMGARNSDFIKIIKLKFDSDSHTHWPAKLNQGHINIHSCTPPIRDVCYLKKASSPGVRKIVHGLEHLPCIQLILVQSLFPHSVLLSIARVYA